MTLTEYLLRFNDVRHVNRGDTLFIGSGDIGSMVEEKKLTQDDADALVKQMRNFKKGILFGKLDCVSSMTPKYTEGQLIFSEPVFTPDLNKMLIGVEIQVQGMPGGFPDRTREIILLEKKNGKWDRLHWIEVD